MTLSSPSLSLFHQILFHLLYNFMILLILFLVCDYSHGPVLLRAGAGLSCDAAQQGASRNYWKLRFFCKLLKNISNILWPLTIFLEGSLSSVTVSCTVPGHLTDWVRVESWEVAERGAQTRLVTRPNPGQYGTSTI